MGDCLSDFFDDPDFGVNDNLAGAPSPEDLFSILNTLELDLIPLENQSSLVAEAVSSQKQADPSPVSQRSTSSSAHFDASETDIEVSPSFKKLKFSENQQPCSSEDGLNRVSHITVERNRRKQMNEHLSVLRSLMPCFYVKRADQASIIGGVVDFIKELQTVLQSLEAKKQRKVYSEVLSPRPGSSPRPPPASPYSPRRIRLPISPRTPQPTSPYRPRMQHTYLCSSIAPSHETSSSFGNGGVKELAANSKSPVADVEVKFSGTNVLLKTISHWIPGQPLKIITALEGLSLETLEAKISMLDNTMLNSFTIKIGIECTLSAEELAQEIQQTFC